MPQIITDENDALDLLESKCAPDVDPTLDRANDLQPIIQQCVRSVIWTADTSYYLGAVVQPTATNRNGHRFILVKFDGLGVKSNATTEPTWPTWDNSRVTDGNCTWQEAGPDYACLWDIPLAAFMAWDLKVQKASACGVDWHTQSLRVFNSQFIENLRKERDRFIPVYV